MDGEGSIARNVRLRMKAKGLGPKALSLKAGLNDTYVRDILKGRSLNPRQEHLRKLASALDCHVSDLTGDLPHPANSDRGELLAAFDLMDERGRGTLLRIAQSLSRDDPPTAPTGSKGPEPNIPTERGTGGKIKAGARGR